MKIVKLGKDGLGAYTEEGVVYQMLRFESRAEAERFLKDRKPAKRWADLRKEFHSDAGLSAAINAGVLVKAKRGKFRGKFLLSYALPKKVDMRLDNRKGIDVMSELKELVGNVTILTGSRMDKANNEIAIVEILHPDKHLKRQAEGYVERGQDHIALLTMLLDTIKAELADGLDVWAHVGVCTSETMSVERGPITLHYILNEDGTTTPIEFLDKTLSQKVRDARYQQWKDCMLTWKRRQIEDTLLPGGVHSNVVFHISTVFLGSDSGNHGDVPTLFETMLFHRMEQLPQIDQLDSDCKQQYTTIDDARAGHKRVVEALHTGYENELDLTCPGCQDNWSWAVRRAAAIKCYDESQSSAAMKEIEAISGEGATKNTHTCEEGP